MLFSSLGLSSPGQGGVVGEEEVLRSPRLCPLLGCLLHFYHLVTSLLGQLDCLPPGERAAQVSAMALLDPVNFLQEDSHFNFHCAVVECNGRFQCN